MAVLATQSIALIDWKADNGSADDVSHYTVSEKQPASTSHLFVP